MNWHNRINRLPCRGTQTAINAGHWRGGPLRGPWRASERAVDVWRMLENGLTPAHSRLTYRRYPWFRSIQSDSGMISCYSDKLRGAKPAFHAAVGCLLGTEWSPAWMQGGRLIPAG